MHAPELWRDQNGHQHKPTRPAHDVSQTAGLLAVAGKPLQVQGTRQTDERGCTHPVCSSGHPVVHRRDPTSGHVVLIGVRRTPRNADEGIDHHRAEQEDRADQHTGETVAFRPGHATQQDQKQEHKQQDIAVQTPAVTGQDARTVLFVHGTGVIRPWIDPAWSRSRPRYQD